LLGGEEEEEEEEGQSGPQRVAGMI
jgi:hypothetical protein